MATYADGAVIISIDADGKLAIKELEKTKEKVEDVGSESEGTKEKVGGLGDEVDKSALKMAAFSASVAVGAKKLLNLGAAAVNASSQFDAAFAKTQTIMDTTTMSVSDMRSEILDLSADSAMAATDVSEAVYQAISGSVATQDAAAFVDQANQLAVAGFTSLTNATDVLTTSLNAYGLEASAVDGISNVLIQTQNLGKTSVDELSASMGRAISTGSAYGVDLQNLATAYVELTRGGIATAEATTYLSGMLNELGDAGSTVGGILQEQTGKSFGQLMADGWSLGDVLQVLSDSVDGNAEALMGLWSSQEAGKASNAIMTQGISDFNEVVAQMNSEMSGATGTTEKAYDTMTDTSEFIDQQLSNSVTNLGIAFGDDLRPAVDEVKRLLTGIIDCGTEFIQQNPLVAASFAGLTIGVGTMAVALALYTIKAKIATSETLKMTAAMATNPIFLTVTAVAALTAGIVTLAASADDGTESIRDMTEASRNLSDAVAEAEATYNETADNIEGTNVVAQQYVDRLRELESEQSLTNAEQQEYAMTVEKLKVLIPDLNAELDEQTGLLEGGADAIQHQIDSWHDLAIAKAIQEKYSAEIQAEADAEVELAENESKRSQLLARQGELEDQLTQKTAEKNRLYQEQSALLSEIEQAKSSGNEYYDFSAAEARLTKYGEKATQLSSEISNLSVELEGIPGDVADVDTAIDRNKAAIEENKGAVEEATAAYQNYVDTQADASGAAGSASAAASAWTDACDALEEAYDTAYASARESIDGQIKLFDDMSGAVTTLSSITQESAQNATAGFISSLDSQIAYMDTYAINMQIAAERGINQGLLQQLNDGSEQSAEILANIVNATDEQIAEMNSKWDEVSEGKDNFADAMTEYTGVVQEEKDEMVELAAQAGKDMSNAITSELLNGFDDFQAAWSKYRIALGKGASKTQSSAASVTRAAYASGTNYAERGFALVGENGPEIVYFRGGERVLTAEETQKALRTVYPTAPQMANLGAGSPAISRGGGIRLQASIAVPLEIDGREFARATAEYNGEEMEWGVM